MFFNFLWLQILCNQKISKYLEPFPQSENFSLSLSIHNSHWERFVIKICLTQSSWLFCAEIQTKYTINKWKGISQTLLINKDMKGAFLTKFFSKVRKVSNAEKITHMWRRWGTPQNFFLAFIGELEKQIIIKKNCWSGAIKNKIILIFTMLHFYKKIKEKHL